MKKTFRLYGPVLVAIGAALWALDGILRRSLYHLPPVTIVFSEHLIGSFLLLPFFLKYASKKYSKKVWKLASIIALISGLLGTLWITTALSKINHIPFSVVLLIQKLQPVFVMISARYLLNEKIGKKYIGWSVIALVATFFLTFKNGQVNLVGGQQAIQAALYSLAAAVVWGTGTTLSKMLLKEITFVEATSLRFFLATAFGFVAMILMGKTDAFLSFDVSQVFRLFIVALSTGVVAMLIYYKGLQKISAKVAAIVELTFPMLAVFIDMFLYKTVLAPTQYMAAAVLIYCMIKVSQRSVSKASSR